jgi:para-nitrobenzyl esterase
MSFFRQLGSSALLIAIAGSMAGQPVRTDQGLVVGIVKDGVQSWKGIPYAAPPLGALRWRAPQPPAPWSGTKRAERFSHDCMQEPYPGDAAPLGETPDEDCLYLNVWAPERHTGKLPVMVWIHGGGFVNGGASPAVYDGAAFARRGLLFVSFNYRLGRFGFFAHPALTAESPNGPLGNYAYLDQIAALQWVKRNAAAFGGDPGNVTIFGESAGGASVHALMTSPLARGLFHRAIAQSGGGRAGGILGLRSLRGTPADPRPSGEAAGTAFAKLAGAEGDGPEALRALRQLPAAAIVRGINMATMGAQADTWVGPTLDGVVLVEDAETAFRAGREAKVPYVVGANSREFGMIPLPPAAAEGMLVRFGAGRETVLAAFDPGGKLGLGEVAVGLMSDSAMVEPARLFARLHAATGAPTFAYRFSYVATSLRTETTGAWHATEIPFVFDTVRARYAEATSKDDEATGALANAYWAAFARTGDPNGDGRPHWPAFTQATDVVMDFALAGAIAAPDPRKARLDLIEQAASQPR